MGGWLKVRAPDMDIPLVVKPTQCFYSEKCQGGAQFSVLQMKQDLNDPKLNLVYI